MTAAAPTGPFPSVAYDGDEVVVVLTPALVADGLADVRWLLYDALLGGARTVVVDLARVPHLDSPLLATLLGTHRVCRARGGAVVLRGAGRRTRDVLARTGLWRVLQLQPGRRRGQDLPG
ncbi:STAS domain-containing protein [Geodermatophilus sp. SYSU D01036]